MRIEEFVEQLKQFQGVDCSGVYCNDCPLYDERQEDACDKLIKICNELNKKEVR